MHLLQHTDSACLRMPVKDKSVIFEEAMFVFILKLNKCDISPYLRCADGNTIGTV